MAHIQLSVRGKLWEFPAGRKTTPKELVATCLSLLLTLYVGKNNAGSEYHCFIVTKMCISIYAGFRPLLLIALNGKMGLNNNV